MPNTNDDNLRGQGRQLWGRRLGRPIGVEEAREIEHNVLGFFEILLEWDAKERGKGKADEAIASQRTSS